MLEESLKTYLEHNLKDQRLKHFNTYPYKMNTSVSNSIYNLLKLCELFKNDYRTSGIDSTLYDATKRQNYQTVLAEIQQEKNKIKQKVDSEKMLYGFTLNMPYTTKKEILEKDLPDDFAPKPQPVRSDIHKM